VKPAHNTKTPQTATGSFAASRALLPVSGSGLSRIGPRAPLVSVLATVLGALAFMSSPALAAAPETPETLKPELETITETAATLRGVLNPHAAGELGGTYEFLYNASETKECKGGGSTTAGMVLGGEAEPVSEPVEGLSPKTEYAVCLVVHSQAKTQEAIGPAVTFITGPPETPEDEVTGVTGTSATLRATLNPHHEGEPDRYRFLYDQSAVECNDAAVEVPIAEEPALIGMGHEAEVVETTVTNLQPATTYTFCVRTENKAFDQVFGQPVTFTTTVAAPSITSESVTSLTSTEATLVAIVSPGGLPTSVDVQYGTGQSALRKQLPASAVPVEVSQHLAGLIPNTHYIAHILTTNKIGADEAIVEFITGGSKSRNVLSTACENKHATGFQATLPDCRAVELVSSASELGEVYDPGGSDGHEEDITTARPFRSALNGSKVAYLADPGPAGGDGSTAKGRGNEFVATRGSTGWQAVNVTPPVSVVESASREREYKSLSSDLTTGVVFSERPLVAANPVPQGPENCEVLYNVLVAGEGAKYSAFFTKTLTPEFCGTTSGNAGRDTSLVFAGESEDHLTKVFDSTAALKAPAEEGFGFGANVYASVPSGEVTLVSVLPNGEPISRAVVGGPSELPQNEPNFGNAVSPTGEKVVWSALTPGESVGGERAAFPDALYATEGIKTQAAKTVQIDESQAGAQGPAGGGQFWAASHDDSKIFFTDCHRLMAGSTAVEEGQCAHGDERSLVKTGQDLYEYDFAKPVGERLTDLTVDHDVDDTLGANVQGVIGVSEDGSYVYFVAGGSLGATDSSQGETPLTRNCEVAPGGSEKEEGGHVPDGFGCNLFEMHESAGKWQAPQFVGTLGARDNIATDLKLNSPKSGGGELAGDWIANLGSRTAEVTPSGGALVFSSAQDLTGYNTAPVGLSEGNQTGNEIFLYGADANKLTCVSCDPRNVPPVASIQAGARGFSTYLPVSSSETFMHRWVNATGTEVFFDSSQPLSEGDSNGTQDVYEWEAEGGSTCPSSTSVYGGCIFLLSSGESEAASFLVDSDESGENVFLTHRGPLYDVGPGDTKNRLYDLRVEGGGAPNLGQGCISTATCPAASVPASIADEAPATSMVSGSENPFSQPLAPPKKKTAAELRKERLAKTLKLCRRERARKRRDSCEIQARRRYGVKKTKTERRKK
jgi:hypothetical protein